MKLLPLLCAFTAALTSVCRSADIPAKPNIIVIFTDDHGWADLGAQGIQKDIRTPHLDALAAGGVRAANGYVTAPQCVPSRAGLLSGRHQQRFGVESNQDKLEGFDAQLTIAERLKQVGYATGMTGKWHLGPTDQITSHGFDDVYCNQRGGAKVWANFDLDGKTLPGGEIPSPLYHLDANAAAACAFIERHAQKPFFFYLAFRGPHTPLDAPPKYTSRFPGPMPERRRQALAMISAIDDGVGRVMATLRAKQLEERTLIFFMGDNGAPLKIHKVDSPLQGDAGGWDGSLNAPMNGEKGMLSEGGVRVPWLAYWKGKFPGGQVFHDPVISLDVAATAAALAGVATKAGELDGVNLAPHFSGENKAAPHDVLFWRWVAQSAVREGKWKLLVGGPRSYLYDLETDPSEKRNLLTQQPDVAKRLRARLESWSAELQPPGVGIQPMAPVWDAYFDHYLDGKATAAPAPKAKAAAGEWVARNAITQIKDGVLHITPEAGGKQRSFLAFAKLKVPGPATATVAIRAPKGGTVGVSWRLDGQADFLPGQTAQTGISASGEFQHVTIPIAADGTVIHLRLHLPSGPTELRQFSVKAAQSPKARVWTFASEP